ncbi:MAG: hypothetical protein V3T62_12085 [Alphaproteobacteria bacterium]
MNRRHVPALRSAGPLPKIMFIAVAGMLIPPTLLVYAIMALTNLGRG